MIIHKKKAKLVSYELHRVMPNVYAAKVDDPYQRAMLFLRYQEFYESPYRQFYRKNFSIFEYMDFYARDRGEQSFTYPSDWSGYNVPSDSLLKCFMNLVDPNPYDHTMGGIIEAINKDLESRNLNATKSDTFYLIGVDKIEGGVMDHEIAHALFFVDPVYRKASKSLVEKMPEKKLEGMKKILAKLGYRDTMFVDEIQAFMATGLWSEMQEIIEEKDRAEFIKLFQQRSLK